jgi:large subunit ribosomal protein L4
MQVSLMPSVDIINLLHEKKGSLDLDDRFFGISVKPDLLHEAILMQLANSRQGTASTKTRGEVRGGGKKPWKQKGTGRARAGSSRSPLWRGGGTTFGPKGQNYVQSFPKKKSRRALYSALTAKLQDGGIKIVEEFPLGEAKTRVLLSMLQGLRLEGKTLIAMESPSTELERAARNLPGVTIQNLRNINPYDIMNHKYLLMTTRDMEALQQKFVSRIKGSHRQDIKDET